MGQVGGRYLGKWRREKRPYDFPMPAGPPPNANPLRWGLSHRTMATPAPTLDPETLATCRRFALRLVVLAGFTLAAAEPLTRLAGFAGALSVLASVFAIWRSERAWAPTLNHWDEAGWYLFIAHGAMILGHRGVV